MRRIDAPSQPAQRLRRARAEAGLSQYQLADKAGVDRMTVARIETGKNDPNLSTVWRFARVLKVPPEWLAGFTSDESKAAPAS